MSNKPVFNPLDKENLGKSVVDALLRISVKPLADVDSFPGAGVYAIYYHGDFPAYAPLSALNQEKATHPIYVGKAIPKGGRKGISTDASLESKALSSRLIQHRKSVETVGNLKIEDFSYHCIVVDDIWIGLGEALIIQRYKPLWNQVVDGFGNHDPGAGRYGGRRPLWDELHPGRDWAMRCKPAVKNRDAILQAVKSTFSQLHRGDGIGLRLLHPTIPRLNKTSSARKPSNAA